jgi:hypothetical protein
MQTLQLAFLTMTAFGDDEYPFLGVLFSKTECKST